MQYRAMVLLVGGMLAVAGGATAASASQPAGATRGYPDWGGVWENKSGIRFSRQAGKDNPPPLIGEYAARYKMVTDAAAAGRPVSDPTANCVWPGTPRVIVAPYPSEYLIQDGRVTIINEYMSQVRRVWTDGRGHPEDLEPSYNGHSIGRWEGDTLIIDTIGLRDDTMIEVSGIPHSDQLRVQERIRLTGPDTLENEVTMTDPLALARPWVTTIRYQRQRDWQILDYVCAENNRNPVSASGKTLTLGPDGQPIDKEQ